MTSVAGGELAGPPPRLQWQEQGDQHHARWLSASARKPPARMVLVDQHCRADRAWRLACEGTALLWRGDYHQARQLLQAMQRRARQSAGRRTLPPLASAAERFHRHRMAQAQHAHALGMLVVEIAPDASLVLDRAPLVRDALVAAFGTADGHWIGEPALLSLRELLGCIGAFEWQRKGVLVPALGARIHPAYGVFSPVRGEYVDLVARQPLPSTALAVDIGTGTGVLAAVLARRGVERVVATDLSPRALACARANIARLQLGSCVEVVEADLFPPLRAPLLVCNPPWLPGKPTSVLEQAIYDPDSRMLRGFLGGAGAHLSDGGEAWLILSDLAEHLGLRSRAQLLDWIEGAGLVVADRADIRPRHRKASAAEDALHLARAAEVTSLWCLRRR